MKKIATIVLSVLLVGTALSAQSATAPAAAPAAATVTKVEGKLALVNGMIAVQAKDKTYYVGGLQHLIGFIDGLKEGASVKLEGYAEAIPVAPEYAHLMVTKLTFNGKDYDLSAMGGRGMGMGMRDGMGRGGMMGQGPGFDGNQGQMQGQMQGRGQRGGRW